MKLETRADKINWAGLLADTRAALEALRLAWTASERDCSPELHEKLVRDLYAPALKQLAAFCLCIEIGEEK